MSAINFVVRDGAGNIQNGSVAGEGLTSSIIVGAGADVSLNLTRGQIVAYTRQGQALEITLMDGRVVVIEGFFTTEGVAENQLFLSADGYLAEVQLTQGAGEDYYAAYVPEDSLGKFAMNDDLYFMRGADVMLADNYIPADDDVGMLGTVFATGLSPLLGLGGAAAAGAAVLGGGGGGGGASAPAVSLGAGTTGAGNVVNAEDYADGVEFSGEGTPGGTVVVTVDGASQETTVDEDGTWEVVFAPGEIPDGTYETDVSVTISNENGEGSASGTLIVDTEVSVDFDSASVGGDGTVNAAENAGSTTLTGTVEEGSTVVVTIEGVDYDAVVTGGSWSLELASGVIAGGEYDLDVQVTATDAYGNSTSTSGTVVVDTLTSVSLNEFSAGGDAIVNGVEHDGGVVLTGMAQPGASVVVTFGAETQTVVAGADGSWSTSWASSQFATGETTVPVSVTATDGAGNTASTSGSVQVDTYVNELTVTSDPVGGDGVVNFDESGEPITITGTVEAGSTVQVTLHETTQNAVVDANGNWTVTFPAGAIAAGEYSTSMTVTATDAAGNTSSLSEAVQVDTVVGDLALSSQPIEIDDVVNAVEASDGVWINGTATPGLLVTVGLGSASHQVYADNNGNWSAKFEAHEVPADTAAAPITASITDAAGNYKEVSDTVEIDTVVENFAFSSAPVEGNDVINAAEASDGVVLSGTVEPGSTVVVQFGGETQTVTATGNGSWTANFSAGSVQADEYVETMTATATDPAGNVMTITDSVQVDTIVNELTVAGPVEGDDVVNSVEASDGITLNGTVEAGSTVMVNFHGYTRQATVDANGNWTVDFTAAEVGVDTYDATVTISATDMHGNTDSITDTFHVDTEVPDAPAIESVTFAGEEVDYIGTEVSDDLTVSQIDAAGNATDLMTSDDGVALPWGEMLFNVDGPLSDGTNLIVTEEDAAGNSNSTLLALAQSGANDVALDGADLGDFNIGAIDLSYAEDSLLEIDLSTLQGLSDVDNNLVIRGGADDQVTLVGATDTASSVTIEGTDYDIFTMGDDGTIFVEQGVTLV